MTRSLKAFSTLRWTFSAALMLAALAPAHTAAQTVYGGIVEVVRDGQGGVVPGVVVTMVNRDTNLTRQATTDAQGT